MILIDAFMDVQISVVVYMFKYPARTALAVGLSMAQIGEFAFVLLSVASQLGLLPYQVYMLLMGAPVDHPLLRKAFTIENLSRASTEQCHACHASSAARPPCPCPAIELSHISVDIRKRPLH